MLYPKTSDFATRSSVGAATSDTKLLAANTNRKGALFVNEGTATLYLAYGATPPASTTSYTVAIPAGNLYELPGEPIFTGEIRGIWSATGGNVRITELS